MLSLPQLTVCWVLGAGDGDLGRCGFVGVASAPTAGTAIRVKALVNCILYFGLKVGILYSIVASFLIVKA